MSSSPAPEPSTGVAGVERELALLLRRAYGVSASLAEEVHPGMRAVTYGTLSLLAAHGAMRGADISAALGLDKSTVSRQLRELVDRGLVERTADPADRRNALAQLTAHGRTRLQNARDARRERLHAQLAAWPGADVDRLAALLHRLNDGPIS